MKLATLRDGSRDGKLVIVRADLEVYAYASSVVDTMQEALDLWQDVAPRLKKLAEDVEEGGVPTHAFEPSRFMAPLPRAYEWVDGSTHLNHVRLVRKARGADFPETLLTDPLVYQGGSGALMGACEDVRLLDELWGLDFESEVCVILGDVPQGVTAENATPYVRLLLLANDWTYRNLVPSELAKGFGFFCSKPATAFSPVAVTPDELGSAWKNGRVFLPLYTSLNEELVGTPNAGEGQHFSFYDLIAHISKTRSFAAGTLLGSGTVSNEDPARGFSCLAEKRAREIIEGGEALSPFLGVGDTVRIEMLDENGRTIFGAIQQQVTP